MRPGPAYTPAWPHWFRTPYAVFAALTLIGLAPVAASAQTMALDAIFEEANDLKDGDACDAAVPLYDEVVLRADARSQLRGWALYNRGICQEQLGDEAGAREAYDTLVAEGPADLRRDARFRLGLVQILSGGDAAVARAHLVAARRGTRGVDRALVDLQLGRLDLDAGRPRRATRRVVRVAATLERARPEERDRRGTHLDWYLGETELLRGDIWLDAAADISLALDGQGRVTHRIAARAEALANAEVFYVRAIEAGHAPWGQIALLHLGHGHRGAAMELDGLRAEAASSASSRVGPTERAALIAWLEPRIEAQLRKAADAWVLCLRVQAELGGAKREAAACQAGVDELVKRREAPE